MINDSISTIKSIGPAREKLFNKVGVYTVEDMLKYYPPHINYSIEIM